MADQAGRLAYAHGSAFTTEPLEAYAREVGRYLPVDGPGDLSRCRAAPRRSRRRSSWPARTTSHAARRSAGSSSARWGSYHGNTLGALDLSGRRTLRRPYEGWLGRFRHVSAAYPYRADMPGAERAGFRRGARRRAGPGVRGGRSRDRRGVRRRADRRGDAGGRRPARRLLAGHRRGLPPPRRAAHRRRGHDRVRADRAAGSRSITGASAPTSSSRPRAPRPGYWPFGFVAASDEVHDDGDRPVPGSSTASRTRTRRSARPSPARSCASSRRSRSSRRAPTKGDRLLGLAGGRVRGPPGGRRDPRPRPDGRHRAGRRPGDARAVPARGPGHRGGRRGRPRARRPASTRGPATPTASTATRSCSGRRSSSPTPELERIASVLADAIEAVAASRRRRREAVAG